MKKVIYLLTILFVFTFSNVSAVSQSSKCLFPVTINHSNIHVTEIAKKGKTSTIISRKKKGGSTIVAKITKPKHTIGRGQSSNDLSKVKTGPKKISDANLAYKKSGPKINQNLAVFHKKKGISGLV